MRGTGSVIGRLLGRGSRSGGFEDFAKVRVTHERHTNPQGATTETWRLALLWKDGMEANLGCYPTAQAAGAQAEGFARALGIDVDSK
jgi:hypothetical protein